MPRFADHCFIDVAHGDTMIRRMQRHARGWVPPAGTWARTGEQIQFPAAHFCQQAMTRLETVLITSIETRSSPYLARRLKACPGR